MLCKIGTTEAPFAVAAPLNIFSTIFLKVSDTAALVLPHWQAWIQKVKIRWNVCWDLVTVIFTRQRKNIVRQNGCLLSYAYLPKYPTPSMLYAAIEIQNPHGIHGYIMTILKGELKRLKNLYWNIWPLCKFLNIQKSCYFTKLHL